MAIREIQRTTMQCAALATSLLAPCAHAQQPPATTVSVAVVEVDSLGGARTRTMAAMVNARLAHATTRNELRVVSWYDVVSTCEVGCPNRWTWQDFRELAKLVRADVVVELTTSVEGKGLTAQALAHQLSTRAVDTLPLVRGVADTAVARELAGHISELLFRVREQRLDNAPGAAQRVTVPTDPFIVDYVRQLARESPLGDLRRRPTTEGDIEVRAWGGLGITGTSAVVLRRERGTWRGWRVRVAHCRADVAIPIADTASATTVERFVARARRRCDATIGDVRAGAIVFDADTLAITRLKADSRTIQRAWDAALERGLLTLPPEVPPVGVVDGFTYVIEVRRGDEYRASSIEDVDKPEVPADAQVKRVYEALSRLATPPRKTTECTERAEPAGNDGYCNRMHGNDGTSWKRRILPGLGRTSGAPI